MTEMNEKNIPNYKTFFFFFFNFNKLSMLFYEKLIDPLCMLVNM